jgi:hypothetical protein
MLMRQLDQRMHIEWPPSRMKTPIANPVCIGLSSLVSQRKSPPIWDWRAFVPGL